MTNNFIYILIFVVFITQMTFYKDTLQVGKGTLFFSCNQWRQKAWEDGRKKQNLYATEQTAFSRSEGRQLSVQREKVSYSKTYETHLHSSYTSLLSPCSIRCHCSTDHVMRGSAAYSYSAISEMFSVHFWTKTIDQMIYSVDKNHSQQPLLQSREVTRNSIT